MRMDLPPSEGSSGSGAVTLIHAGTSAVSGAGRFREPVGNRIGCVPWIMPDPVLSLKRKTAKIGHHTQKIAES
jgi:hypothetical protein